MAGSAFFFFCSRQDWLAGYKLPQICVEDMMPSGNEEEEPLPKTPLSLSSSFPRPSHYEIRFSSQGEKG